MKRIFTVLIGTLLLSFSIYAQSGVGKLSGKVIDADTKEPLVGANIVILNTDWGAATNVEGEYFVLNVPPGNYDVRFSYVGYAPKTVQNVRIVAGVTYELNVELSTDFTLPEIVVQDKKFFEEKATNTKKIIDSDQINRLPVKGVERLASLQSGVVMAEGSGGSDGNATLNVRGGRGGEVLYIVDGIPQNDVFTGANYSQVSNAAIEQIAFEIGGYEAKYGQAQSGIVNVTTKTGSANYSLYADVLTSSYTDNYGYNLYTGTLGGPIIPGNPKQTFFLSFERGWFKDADPRAINYEFPSINKSYDFIPENDAGVYRITAKTSHGFGDWTARLGANINTRTYRGVIQTYMKHNPEHNTRNEQMNQSYSFRLSQNVSSNSFWNLNLGYKFFKEENGDGIWFDNLLAYGDSLENAKIGVTLPKNGQRVLADEVGIFFKKGRVSNGYSKYQSNTLTGDFDFTTQVQNHLIEVGFGANYHTLRNYFIAPVGLAADNIRNLPLEERFFRLQPSVFGYDITGSRETSADNDAETEFAPKTPLLAYGYVQDRFELEDIVLNLGVRFDYFDTKTDVLKNPNLPYAAGDPSKFDKEDFVEKKPEFKISPRIGLGFPVTATTVFHAQYGKFIQQPRLDQLYTSKLDLNDLVRDAQLTFLNGQVRSEETTQYEIGFRQVLGNVAALNITAFYKNTKGLINQQLVFFQRVPGGQTLEYYAPTNTDFGTIKGLAFSLDVARVSYFSMSLNYTYSIAEGTGSSTGSNFVAAFRNTGPDRIPKVIAPLDFDQRHTGTINVDFYVPKGDLGIFELLNANVLVSFNSGRPYTPLAEQNLLEGSSNWGETKGYVNSAYGPGNFRVDLKLEKGFALGSAMLTPYVQIENLFDADNPVSVYRSTGSPYTTAWLTTQSGRTYAEGTPDPEKFKQDYQSLERDPFNFGIPRTIKLGFKVNFANISF
uniref:TonB-dependent receptor n=1 Tax=Ignavibacterium album TaxID=591197 RepID=A0A832G7X1_9BACT